jgi:hypothetical protein
MEDEDKLGEVGAKTWDEWVTAHAPRSYTLCYGVKRRYKALKQAGVSEEAMRLMPPQTADWASRSKNISPAALLEPKAQEALKLPLKKAVKELKESMPEQHIEEPKRLNFKFEAGQVEVIERAYATFKAVKDATASFAEFIEFCVTEWVLAAGGQK